MRFLLSAVLGGVLWFVSGQTAGAMLSADSSASPAQAPSPAPPGVVAPTAVVQELNAALGRAVQQFEARDVAGVLAHVSDQYRTGPFTKAGIRQQLVAIYTIYDAVQARVRIDEVRIVGGHAWVYSTGEVSGRLPLVGTWVLFLSWKGELEVTRREGGVWRLFGYQQ